MKKFTLFLASLFIAFSAMSQIVNYGKSLWTFPATNHADVEAVPAEIFTDFTAQYADATLEDAKVGVYTVKVTVPATRTVTARFQYSAGNKRMDISGVDLVKDGQVVYSDYHFGYTGGNSANNNYTMADVEPGEYLMRFFIAAQKEDITPSSQNDSKGQITLGGTWFFPTAATADNKPLYYIKNVRSPKLANLVAEGQQLTLVGNATLGSYWYFEEATAADLPQDATPMPANCKAYWIYNAAVENPIENPSNGRFAEKNVSWYPAKIYYIAEYTKGDKTGLYIRPCNEDGASWNDLQGNKVTNFSYDDAGSVWMLESVYGVTDETLKNQAATAKTNAINLINSHQSAYYYNLKPNQTEAALEELNGIATDQLSSAVQSLMSNQANTIATNLINASAIQPKAGDSFIMVNRGRGGYLRAYAEGDVKASAPANDLNALDLVWTLVAADGDFKLYNERQGVYLGVLSGSNNTKFQYVANVEDAGIYEISQTGPYTLFHAKGQDGNGHLHQSNWGGKEIVRWDTGDASQWQLFAAPFELTTDKENPICYVIKSGRAGGYYFGLNGDNVKLFNGRTVATDRTMHWFFMLDADKNLKMYALNDTVNSMGYVAVAGGNTKITKNATNKVGDAYSLYFNTDRASEFQNMTFALRPTSGDTFVSNHGGTDNNMGFHNDYNDLGTRIAFESVSHAALVRQLQLEYPIGEHVGQYTIPAGYEEALNAALDIVNNKTVTAADYAEKASAMIKPLINLPVAGQFYRVKNNAGNGYLNSGTGDGRTQFVSAELTEATQASTIFYYTGSKLVSYSNGLYISDDGAAKPFLHYTNTLGAAVGREVAFGESPTIGKFNITYANNRYFYSDGVGNSNAGGDVANPNGNYQFTIEEVTELPVAIAANTLSGTVYSPVELGLNGLVKAFVGTLNDEKTELTVTEVEAVPANTGVIVTLTGTEAPASGYVFLPIQETTITDAASDMTGAFETIAIASTETSKQCIYNSYDEEINGEPVAESNFVWAEGNAANIKGFTAYVVSSEAEVVTIVGANGEGNPTGIEEVETAPVQQGIYDLQGRRLSAPVKGINIINGKKVLVK